MRKKIGILSFPGKKMEVTPLSNLTKIICQLSTELYIITGNFKPNSSKSCRIHKFEVNHEKQDNLIKRALGYFFTQIDISIKLLKIKEVDIWIFFIGGETLVLPMLIAKLLRKKVFLLFPGSVIETMESSHDLFYQIAKILSRINCRLSDRIILYSTIFIRQWKLKKYKNKITIAHRHFINFNKFRIKNDFNKRSNVVGYIGRLSEEKGVLNFFKAIPKILKKDDDIKFLVVGDGFLKDEMSLFLKENNLEHKVEFIEWIPHKRIPDLLNKIKLLVIPSYTEGIPNIMLEAMACGTLVLSTNVGGVPDIIEDGSNGFLIEDNSPETISKNVISILQDPNMDIISQNGSIFVNSNFSFDQVLSIWNDVLVDR